MIVTLLGIVMLFRDEHCANAPVPVSVKLLGSVTSVKDVQLKNALVGIIVMLLGIVTLVSDEQYSYLQPVITQYFASNKSEIWS